MLIILEHKGQKITIDTGVTESTSHCCMDLPEKSPTTEPSQETAELVSGAVRGLFSEPEGQE